MVSIYALLALNVVGGLLGVGREYLESFCQTKTDTGMVVTPAQTAQATSVSTALPPKKATKKGKRKKSKPQKEE